MSYRIFLVEDHAAVCVALTLLIDFEPDLELCGIAASAEEALEREAWARCDVLVTDVSLPGMDGLTLSERIRAERPDLPIIVISAYVDPSKMDRVREVGARAYLSKGELGDTLARTLREVLRGNGTAPLLHDGEKAADLR